MQVKIETMKDIQTMLEMIEEIVHRHNTERGAAIPILQDIQDRFGYVAPAILSHVAEAANLNAADLYAIATFYSQFRLEPLGEHVIKVCHGTACHLAGADKIAQALTIETGACEGHTSSDGKFTHERVACLGCCSLAPVAMIDGETHGRLTPEKIRKLIKDLRQADEQVAADGRAALNR